MAAATPIVRVDEVTPAQVERALAWQALRLEFQEMPLRDVVAEFNRYNRRQLLVRDPATAAVLVGGNFRADNAEAFVRLLGASFGIVARAEGDDLVLELGR
ncbi:MAG: hypothetical protein CFE45_39530 [Burkholderiales bacterium PBB5]|nr:MAG: hypothetical protein CFE45_39530 [Burkholderiales bacterium PBB5]